MDGLLLVFAAAGLIALASPTSKTALLFVYGTMRRGEEHHGWLEGSTFLGRATIPGRRHRDKRGPSVVDGTGLVHGEVYEVSRALLRKLDALEGPDWIRTATQLGPGTAKGRDAWVYAEVLGGSRAIRLSSPTLTKAVTLKPIWKRSGRSVHWKMQTENGRYTIHRPKVKTGQYEVVFVPHGAIDPKGVRDESLVVLIGHYTDLDKAKSAAEGHGHEHRGSRAIRLTDPNLSRALVAQQQQESRDQNHSGMLIGQNPDPDNDHDEYRLGAFYVTSN